MMQPGGWSDLLHEYMEYHRGECALADEAQLRSRGHVPTAGNEGAIQDALRERPRQRGEVGLW